MNCPIVPPPGGPEKERRLLNRRIPSKPILIAVGATTTAIITWNAVGDPAFALLSGAWTADMIDRLTS